MGSVCNAPFFSFHIMWTNKIFWNKNEIENILVAESTEKSLKASHFKMELSYHYTNIKLLPCLFSYLSKYRLSGLDEFFFGICCFAFDAISYRNKGLSFSSNLTFTVPHLFFREDIRLDKCRVGIWASLGYWDWQGCNPCSGSGGITSQISATTAWLTFFFHMLLANSVLPFYLHIW